MQAVYTDYEPTGKIGQIDYHNGTATKYTYDAWSTKLFGIVTEDPTRDPLKLLQDREYTYSRAGDILQIVDHVQKVTYDYAYDKLHRLVSEKLSGTNAPIVTRVETITLDYTGTGPVHGVKQITLNGVSRTCAYDLNGNMTTSPDFTNGANPLNRAITYDADNMPTRIVHANGATVDFVYDGVGKRTKKLVQSGKTVLYLGDHFEVENGVNIKYIFGGNLRLAQIKGSLTSYFHKDHLNSTAAVTNAAGVKVESTTYEPFGSTRTQEGTAVSAYKFTDQELDNETGLYNYDARLYDPVIGMFVTPDSIVQNMFDPQSLNRFTYCRNNPLIYTDPSGHDLGNHDEGGPEKETKDFADKGSSIGLGKGNSKGNGSNSYRGREKDPDKPGRPVASYDKQKGPVHTEKGVGSLNADGSVTWSYDGYIDTTKGRLSFKGLQNTASTNTLNEVSSKIESSLKGYKDINFSAGYWGGVTFGIMFGKLGISPYLGGGFVTPGGSVTITGSPDSPSSGWNIGFQGQAIGAVQFGWSFGEDGGFFWEGGAGYPAGASLTGYYAWGPFFGPKNITE